MAEKKSRWAPSESRLQRPPPLPFPCSVCARPFLRRDNLQRHLRLAHPSTAHTCGVCAMPACPQLIAARARRVPCAPLRELKTQEALALARDREVRALAQSEVRCGGVHGEFARHSGHRRRGHVGLL